MPQRDDWPVTCSVPGCGEDATFKVAAPWNDHQFWELKTYGFACDDHLIEVLRSAEARWLNYEPVPGEAVGMIAVYRYEKGLKDRHLEPLHLDDDWRDSELPD